MVLGSERQQEISTMIPYTKIPHTSRRSHFQFEKDFLIVQVRLLYYQNQMLRYTNFFFKSQY